MEEQQKKELAKKLIERLKKNTRMQAARWIMMMPGSFW